MIIKNFLLSSQDITDAIVNNLRNPNSIDLSD